MASLYALIAIVGVVWVPFINGALQCGSAKVREGGCPEFYDTIIRHIGGADEAACAMECQSEDTCVGFVLSKSTTPGCWLFKAGCTQGGNLDKYEYFDFHRCSCLDSLCKNDATCTEAGFGVQCKCTGGWEGETCSERYCPKELGYCLRSDGKDQNSGVVKKNSLDGKTKERQDSCLEECRAYPGATGCEVIWDRSNRGCYVHTKDVARGNGKDKYSCWAFGQCQDMVANGGKFCPKEAGYCVKNNGKDQNSGVVKLNKIDGNTQNAQEECLSLCQAHPGATGCEIIWSLGSRGCYAHTKEVARGNGKNNHSCWVFSSCVQSN